MAQSAHWGLNHISQAEINTDCVRILKLWTSEGQGGAVSVSFLVSAGAVYKVFGLSLIVDPIANNLPFIHRSRECAAYSARRIWARPSTHAPPNLMIRNGHQGHHH